MWAQKSTHAPSMARATPRRRSSGSVAMLHRYAPCGGGASSAKSSRVPGVNESVAVAASASSPVRASA